MRRATAARAALALLLGAIALALTHGGVPYLTRETRWAIGIYGGPSPLQLGPIPAARNPVLTADRVTDVPARFVADPFLVHDGRGWLMFFEVLNAATGHGEIAVANSADGHTWDYGQVVLSEPFHLSYPYVVVQDDTYYLIPESAQAQAVRLYRAEPFPSAWRFVETLLSGAPFSDPSLVQHDGHWWLFVATDPATNGRLDLYLADRLEGPWRPHPLNPVVRDDPHGARPAGRVLALGDRLVRFAQDDAPRYGNQVWAFEIATLTPTAYAERRIGELPVVGAGDQTWNARGMHHVDAHQLAPDEWIASVDGNHKAWALRYWTWR